MISARDFFIAALCTLFLSLPAAAGTPDVFIIEHGPRESGKVCLTFDACPTGRQEEYDERVIEILIKEKVPATLFISGRWAEKNPDKVKFLSRQPQFEIANHGYHHLHMTEITEARIRSELAHTQGILMNLTGMRPRLFRPPFGEVDGRLAQLACEEGLITIQYDIASGDPDPDLSPQAITRAVLRQARAGSIIVFHMNRNGRHTAELLPSVISGLRDKGFEFATVGRLLDLSAGEDKGLERDDYFHILYPHLQALRFGNTHKDRAADQLYVIRNILSSRATSGPLYNAGAIRCGSFPR